MKFITVIAGVALAWSLAIAKEATATIKVKEMTCESCGAAVKKALTSTKGVKDADVSLEMGTATVVYEDSQVTEKQLANVIKKAQSEAQQSKTGRKEKPMQTPSTSPSVSGLEPLFTAVLNYRSDSPESSVIPNEEREGAFIGSGDGAATGERLSGTVRWSLWSGSCVYPLVRKG
jgi:copper chaperone